MTKKQANHAHVWSELYFDVARNQDTQICLKCSSKRSPKLMKAKPVEPQSVLPSALPLYLRYSSRQPEDFEETNKVENFSPCESL